MDNNIDESIVPEFEILLEDGPLLAVNKPFGLLTQAPEGIDSLEFRVKEYLILREQKPGRCYLGVPHRLDRPASGAILFAKHVRAARRLSEQFEWRTIKKTYWAAVSGRVEEPTGAWIDFMKKVKGAPHAKIVPPIDPEAREAVLHFQVLGTFEWGTWLEIQLLTGRMHQIRLQSGSRGFPLLGDAQYGSTVTFGPQWEDERLRGIALHARSISFNHPMTRDPLTVTAPVPPEWNAIGIHEATVKNKSCKKSEP